MGENRTARTRVRAAVLPAAIAAGLVVGASNASADTTGPQVPFDAVVARARLVVVGTTKLEPGGGVTVVIERVLAGVGPSSGVLHFEGDDPPELVDGGEAVIAFSNPATIDADAPTVAWEVSRDGYVDPDGLARVQDVPPTLAAMYTWFGQPMTAPRTAGGAGATLDDVLVPILLVLVALAAAEGGIARRERGRR